MFFKHFASKNLPGFYISQTLVENRLISHFLMTHFHKCVKKSRCCVLQKKSKCDWLCYQRSSKRANNACTWIIWNLALSLLIFCEKDFAEIWQDFQKPWTYIIRPSKNTISSKFPEKSIPKNLKMWLTHFSAMFSSYKLINSHCQKAQQEKL